MNVIRPQAAPGRPLAATQGLIDVDIHPRARSMEDYFPWLSAAMRERVLTYGIRPRHGFSKGTPYFKSQPLACRQDAWPAQGGTPASDPALVASQHLDFHGIDVGVLNPLQPTAQGDQNNPFSVAMAHAVNEWQLATWVDNDDRLKASVVVAYEDPEASAKEIRLRAGDPRFCQVLLMSRTSHPLGNPKYWPIFEAAQEVGLPIGIHAFGYSGWPMTNGGWPSFYIEEVSEHATSCQSLVVSMVLEGVFECFPKLKVVLIECGFGWMPSVAWRLDKQWPTLKHELPHVKRLPSEQIREHIWVSTQPVEEPPRPEQLLDCMEWIGWDKILFASDYPHWDFDDPRYAIPSYIPEAKRAAIYGGNAKKVYGFR
ncbi:amidohydrolase family protein [Roseococcus sp.]|uniref:amidohydrolase family protein n=1 Tax=Roseococcus sp. TaxID=2109646 RepID=UPI003BA8CEBD